MLRIGGSFENIGSMSWMLVLCLAASWLMVFACLFKGVKSSGKVVYFTATFPYVVLLILLIRGVTLSGPGPAEGLLFYVKPDVKKLLDWQVRKTGRFFKSFLSIIPLIQVWKDAAEQVFFSLGPAFGGLMTMASYNKFHTNCKRCRKTPWACCKFRITLNESTFRDAIMISFIDSFTSTFAGFAIFSTTGFLARELRVPIDAVTQSGKFEHAYDRELRPTAHISGKGLAFIVYPEAISRMPVSPIWSILFFFMLITLGMDSEVRYLTLNLLKSNGFCFSSQCWKR